MSVREAFEKYAAKAPVGMPGPQQAAARALQVFRHLLTKHEWEELGSALSHALHVREGREEFDGVCAQVRARLFPGGA